MNKHDLINYNFINMEESEGMEKYFDNSTYNPETVDNVENYSKVAIGNVANSIVDGTI